jgi:hypothetical protein
MRKSARVAVAAGMLLLVTFGAAGASSASFAMSGVFGRVTLFFSPCSPQTCNPPAKTFTLVFTRQNMVAARVATNAKGRFRRQLKPGRYSVSSTRPQVIGWGLRPNRVTVTRGAWKRVDFQYDTGRR